MVASYRRSHLHHTLSLSLSPFRHIYTKLTRRTGPRPETLSNIFLRPKHNFFFCIQASNILEKFYRRLFAHRRENAQTARLNGAKTRFFNVYIYIQTKKEMGEKNKRVQSLITFDRNRQPGSDFFFSARDDELDAL